MSYSKHKNDVTYYKPLCVCKKGTHIVGYQYQNGQWSDLHTDTRPIAYSTVATRGWLEILHEESTSWEDMLNKANGSSGEYINDPEAVQVIEAYMKCKAPFDSMEFRA